MTRCGNYLLLSFFFSRFLHWCTNSDPDRLYLFDKDKRPEAKTLRGKGAHPLRPLRYYQRLLAGLLLFSPGEASIAVASSEYHAVSGPVRVRKAFLESTDPSMLSSICSYLLKQGLDINWPKHPNTSRISRSVVLSAR